MDGYLNFFKTLEGRYPLSAFLFVILVNTHNFVYAVFELPDTNILFLFRINPENDLNISISFMAKVILVLLDFNMQTYLINNGWISEFF
jgi:hypothetical protein